MLHYVEIVVWMEVDFFRWRHSWFGNVARRIEAGKDVEGSRGGGLAELRAVVRKDSDAEKGPEGSRGSGLAEVARVASGGKTPRQNS